MNAFGCFPMACSEVSCPYREAPRKVPTQSRQKFRGLRVGRGGHTALSMQR